jgi:hypothetical protein
MWQLDIVCFHIFSPAIGAGKRRFPKFAHWRRTGWRDVADMCDAAASTGLVNQPVCHFAI